MHRKVLSRLAMATTDDSTDFVRKERCVDDTVHYDTDLDQHWWRTRDFICTVGEAGIVLNPEKFQFCSKSVEFTDLVFW